MGHTVRVAVATLNQWAMDFQGNLERILRSIEIAVAGGATYRTGPELEVSGYSCEDHFHEPDTYLHCWEVLLELMRAPAAQNMLIDVGMPVQHRNVAYNCRVAFYNERIVLVRPKMIMCDDGNYRETRWFSPWTKERQTEELQLPRFVALALGQETVPIGDAVIATRDTCLGYEICEELWNPRSKHIDMSLAGVEIIVNGSGSYMQLRKAHITTDLIRNASYKAGGAYLFSNLRGCDGQRVYFNGCSAVALNGQVVARGRQFALGEVEVTVAAFDLQDIRAYRGALRSRSSLAASTPTYPRIQLPIELAGLAANWHTTPAGEPQATTTQGGEWSYHRPEEEIALGPACWLWDYLRRSGQGGFFLPLSGGVDSSSTAIIVYSMCRLVVEAVAGGDRQVRDDCRKILADPDYLPTDAGDLCGRLLFTCYMGTENSSQETRRRASTLAAQIRSHHLDIGIDTAVSALLGVFRLATGQTPRFRTDGGCPRQNLALQNIQARTRMVLAYLFAQLMLWVRGRPGGLLVLGSANVDEALRGYMTKYDCSSADVNPIGGISKVDLRRFLAYAQREFSLPVVAEIVQAPPTAELEPLVDGAIAQTDEQDMGLTYAELGEFGRLRKQAFCGPFSMFCKLAAAGGRDPAEIADKVKHFFRCYAINRHKMTVLTPSYHAESYSPDDNRFDHRPFLYRANWTWQFRAIDAELEQLARHHHLHHTPPNGSTAVPPPLPPPSRPADEHDSSPHDPSPTTGTGDHHGTLFFAGPHTGSANNTTTTTMSGAASAHHLYLPGDGQLTVAAGLPKSQSSGGYSRMHSSVMGKIKDRTGVPV
ncbi:glutamine-dependent NAD(+) synthetase [Anopheles ziemanni]|uniref:glutamine-dependent NAD(+) synthetase n=1 Tax=Anopheles coustani TaxID=139045 RepID=UPI002658FB98|nr:glutamine-dependent NAD(+) synthetase [Anopheles coustani]XP_058176356.1 glutamine-dependent NAD(+) synthetase [Anopheles ziemanni]